SLGRIVAMACGDCTMHQMPMRNGFFAPGWVSFASLGSISTRYLHTPSRSEDLMKQGNDESRQLPNPSFIWFPNSVWEPQRAKLCFANLSCRRGETESRGMRSQTEFGNEMQQPVLARDAEHRMCAFPRGPRERGNQAPSRSIQRDSPSLRAAL